MEIEQIVNRFIELINEQKEQLIRDKFKELTGESLENHHFEDFKLYQIGIYETYYHKDTRIITFVDEPNYDISQKNQTLKYF